MSKHPLYLGLIVVIVLTSCTVTDATTLLTSTTVTPTLTVTATLRPNTTPTRPMPTATVPASLSDVAPSPSATATRPAPINQDSDLLTSSSQNDQLPPTLVALEHDSLTTVDCTVSGDTLNLREGPGTNYTQISTLSGGTIVSARKCSPGADWLLVETRDQIIGWVNTGFLRCQSDPKTLPIAAGIFPPTSTPAVNTSSTTATHTPTPPDPIPTSPIGQPPTGYWQAEYYANASLLGQPTLVRDEADVDFNWILHSPDPAIPADNFSARWTRILDFTESGDYRFFAEADDGVKVYVDGWPVIDAWHTETPIIHVGNFAAIQKGPHTVVVEYFESGGYAHIKVWAEKVELGQSGWRGEYYDNPDWREPAQFVRQDEALDFDWGDSSPGEGLGRNHFSVRWESRQYFEQGDYRFYADIADRDQVRLYLDGWLLIDEDREWPETVEGYFANVGAGHHTITVEYQEDVGQAKIRVWWQRE